VEEEIFARDSATCDQLDRELLREAWDDFLAERWDGGRLFYALWLYEAWARVVVSDHSFAAR
jgi:hypothetical protein